MGRNQTKADMLLAELRGINKNIVELERDIEASRSTLLSSPQWSDMKTSGGLKQSQTDKVVNVIDRCEVQFELINEMIERKNRIMRLIYKLKDTDQINVLIAGYLTYETFNDAWDSLGMSKGKFHTIKRKAIDSLNSLI